jgi:diaminohydroxyphosphoribosylaminopyrimidine deaminase/5-amino-6-(5-phosphoribosylamino)uracil reductase
MRRALRLAERGCGHVSPNPLVGAVLVRDGEIVGEGAHLNVGGLHAEAHAIAAAGDRARDSTLYVTLEPCSHHGRTPPCAEAVIKAGIRHVICAVEDPDEAVSGRGYQLLRAAGVKVESGLLEAAAQRQNAAYMKHRRTGLPHVTLKLGQSLDGVIATRSGDSRWITSERSRRHAHKMRAHMDAIVVGAGTVMADDPRLDVRLVRGPNPKPFIVDGKLRTTPGACVFSERQGVLLTGKSAPVERLEEFRRAQIEVWAFDDIDGVIDLQAVVARAGEQGIMSMLVEGGRTLAAAALRDRIVDEVVVYVAPLVIGEGVSAIGDLGVDRLAQAIHLDEVRTRRLGADLLYTATVRYSCSPES